MPKKKTAAQPKKSQLDPKRHERFIEDGPLEVIRNGKKIKL